MRTMGNPAHLLNLFSSGFPLVCHCSRTVFCRWDIQEDTAQELWHTFGYLLASRKITCTRLSAFDFRLSALGSRPTPRHRRRGYDVQVTAMEPPRLLGG